MNDDAAPEVRPPRQDNERPAPPPDVPGFSDDLVMGLRFYSRLPCGDRPFATPDLSRMALALPFASLLIGLPPALLLMAACWIGLPPYFAAALAIAASVVITGAMAEDAAADAADGLFGGTSVEQRLAIMKDSRHGTYGVTGICLYVLLRVLGLGALAAVNPVAAAGCWLAAGVAARSGSLWLSLVLPAARQAGASASVGRVSRNAFAIGCGFSAVLVFVLAAPFASVLGVLLAVVAATVIALSWGRTCRRLIGGQTGDVIGALQAMIEIAVLTLLLVFT